MLRKIQKKTLFNNYGVKIIKFSPNILTYFNYKQIATRLNVYSKEEHNNS